LQVYFEKKLSEFNTVRGLDNLFANKQDSLLKYNTKISNSNYYLNDLNINQYILSIHNPKMIHRSCIEKLPILDKKDESTLSRAHGSSDLILTQDNNIFLFLDIHNFSY
jgi:hypothetical protein